MAINSAIRTFEGATSIVTGGASGIGRALAEELAIRGSEVVIADRQIELAQEVAEGLCAAGRKATSVCVDVANFPEVEQLVQSTVSRTGRIDYMFNNAGITLTGHVEHYAIEDWNLILDVNLRGVIHGVQAVHSVMLEQGFGHIVNTSSMAGFFPVPGDIGYTTTKHAIFGLSRALRAEVAHRGIRVSVLCPGAVLTPALSFEGKYGKMLMKLSPEQLQHMKDMMLNQMRPMQPAHFARKALDSVAKNRAIIVIPSSINLYRWLDSLFPSFTLSFIQKSFLDVQRKIGVID